MVQLTIVERTAVDLYAQLECAVRVTAIVARTATIAGLAVKAPSVSAMVLRRLRECTSNMLDILISVAEDKLPIISSDENRTSPLVSTFIWNYAVELARLAFVMASPALHDYDVYGLLA